jgi:hypothetical protein
MPTVVLEACTENGVPPLAAAIVVDPHEGGTAPAQETVTGEENPDERFRLPPKVASWPGSAVCAGASNVKVKSGVVVPAESCHASEVPEVSTFP